MYGLSCLWAFKRTWAAAYATVPASACLKKLSRNGMIWPGLLVTKFELRFNHGSVLLLVSKN
jgi:hypothetical protein